MAGFPRAGGGWSVVLLLLSTAAIQQGTTAAGAPTRALVVVKTLVIDGMGTRTVDTNSARVPFGSKGLLVKKVPYAGPALSFRLQVLAGAPQDTGIPLTLSADVWSGDTTTLPRAEDVSRREEATVLAPESSYIFEIDHDPKTDRRIVLSVSARPIEEGEMIPSLAADQDSPIQFLMEVTRESGGVAGPPEVHLLSSMVGRAVTYSSGIKVPAPPGEPPRIIGLSVTMTAEQVQGSLVTVKVELSGSEFIDEGRTRTEPISRTEVHTITSGSRFEVQVTVPEPDPGHPDPPQGARPVLYRVGVTPTLG